MTNFLNSEVLVGKANKIKFFFTDVDGTLTNGCTYYSEKGEAMKSFNHRDGTAIALLNHFMIGAGIITGENSEIVKRRAEKLKINHCFLGIANKAECLHQFADENKFKLDEIAYIGDDLNDLQVMQLVGLSFAAGDASTLVKDKADIICTAKGGEGAFREAVEILLMLRNDSIDSFLDLL